MARTLGNLTKGLRDWNKTIYGHIGKHKCKLISSLKKVQHEVERTNSVLAVSREMSIRAELEKVLDQEELLWKQKSWYDWLSLGDKNTKFFITEQCTKEKLIASTPSVTAMAFGYMSQKQFCLKRYRSSKICERYRGTTT